MSEKQNENSWALEQAPKIDRETRVNLLKEKRNIWDILNSLEWLTKETINLKKDCDSIWLFVEASQLWEKWQESTKKFEDFFNTNLLKSRTV